MKFLEWFIKDEMQKKWAELGGYTCNAAVLKSEEFRKATPYNEAFYQTMFMVKDFWAVPEYAELLTADQQPRLSVRRRRRGHGQGGARRARRRTGTTTFKKYGRGRLTAAMRTRRRRCAPPVRLSAQRSGEKLWRQLSMTRLDPGRARRRAG